MKHSKGPKCASKEGHSKQKDHHGQHTENGHKAVHGHHVEHGPKGAHKHHSTKAVHEHKTKTTTKLIHEHDADGVSDSATPRICEFNFKVRRSSSAMDKNSNDRNAINEINSKISNIHIKNGMNEIACDETDKNEFRWAAEFMSGPGGYLEKAEIVSRWFETIEDAKEDAYLKAEQEMTAYPFSRGKILKLVVEDNNGTVTELQNAQDNVPQR